MNEVAKLVILQVGFFSGICIPCYSLLSQIMPTVSPMVELCADNLASWRKLAEERRQEKTTD